MPRRRLARLGGEIRVTDAGGVLAWGVPRLRDLPWRHTRDAWLVLAAEVMLQQTQAQRVLPKWQALIERYPRPSSLAASPLSDVLRLWHGLGYPRRARNLHAAATVIATDHDDTVPADLDALLALPGVGPYTARAVLTFSYEHDVGVVDTNIARVLARTAGQRLTHRAAQSRADELVPPGDGWAWNQVLMDLGAAICRPAPRCGECPLTGSCVWHRAGHPEPDPAIGSAGVSTPQAPYEGSARQARGRVLRRLMAGACRQADLEDDIRPEIIDSLLADGLIVLGGDATVQLP
jgi:A/G-specific adenine glycosylase